MADPSFLHHELVLDAVREVNGRRPVRPAATIEAAEAEVRDFLVVPEWYAGEAADAVAATCSASSTASRWREPVPLVPLR